jgi:hypothetical protein
MPTEGATNIAGLDPANPSSTAPAGEGDDHLRMIKEVLLASFPALDGLISNAAGDGTTGNTDPPDAATFSQLFTKSSAAFEAKVPIGGIILWSGAEADVPAGWQLCNGLNNTPDLRERFVVGSDDSSVYTTGQSGGQGWDTTSLAFPILKTSTSPDPTSQVTAGGTVTIDDQLHGHWYLPPFYALAYIMYVGP